MENKSFEIKYKVNTTRPNLVWHTHVTLELYRNNNFLQEIYISETFMGCGIMQMNNFYNLKLLPEEIEVFKDFLLNKFTSIEVDNKYSCQKVGLIICTLGGLFRNSISYKAVEFLNDMEFKELAEYNNWRHKEDGSETQKLYGLKTNYKDKKNI